MIRAARFRVGGRARGTGGAGRRLLPLALVLAVGPLLASCAPGADEGAGTPEDGRAADGAVGAAADGDGVPGPDGAGAAAADGAAGGTDAVGCYRFEPREVGGGIRLPWGVALESAPLGEGWPSMERLESVRLARTATGPERRTDHPFGYWRPLPGDSVEIGHPGGGGLVLRASPGPEGLTGVVRSAGDAVPPGQDPDARTAQPVRAARIPCDGSGAGGP